MCSRLLVCDSDLDRASAEVVRVFLCPMENLLLNALIDAHATRCEDGCLYRKMTTESELLERIKISAGYLKALLFSLKRDKLVVCMCEKGCDKVNFDERQWEWGVNSEKLADAIVYKLKKVCTKATNRPKRSSEIQKYVCVKCGATVSALNFDLSCTDESGFVCVDAGCRGEVVEESSPVEVEEHALLVAAREAESLLRVMQRALP